ncbi:MAG: mannose-1-phosphate guanylyltransferase, partial [Rickettsiales bacterium]|nr:mannose-1-phosphate guanylyltransferase [Rickettsiales bacterium]
MLVLGMFQMGSGCIYPVILCGGAGNRLWPLSRHDRPKPFHRFPGMEQTLFVQTLRRLLHPDLFHPPIIIANDVHRFTVAEQAVQALGYVPAIILEPEGRNTAPAIATAVEHIHTVAPDAIIFITPADHVILDDIAFCKAIEQAMGDALAGKLVTFGIPPTRPETGYGYIERHQQNGNDKSTAPVYAFTEKPSKGLAEEMAASDKYLWNSGIFMGSVSTFRSEIETHAPNIASGARLAYGTAVHDRDFLRLNAEHFGTMPAISFDYAVMEHTKQAVVMPFACGWADAGSWDSIWQLTGQDKDGNVCEGACHTEATQNSYLHSTGPVITTLGVRNLAIIATEDAVLVADRHKAQYLKPL